MRLLIGTNLYPARGHAARRQAAAADAVATLSGVARVNVQFADRGDAAEHPGFETVYSLTRDSRTVSGFGGVRKPVVRDLFDALCGEAERRGLPYFCLINSDIRVTQRLVELVAGTDRDAFIFSRMDFDGATGQDETVFYWGQDAFVVRAAWWATNRHRFRPYILGEPLWDTTYTSILLCHADTVLDNRVGLIRHESHPVAWGNSPYYPWAYHLLYFDRPYIELWRQYCGRLQTLRSRIAPEHEESALLAEYFPVRLRLDPPLTRLSQAAKAFGRYYLTRAGVLSGRPHVATTD